VVRAHRDPHFKSIGQWIWAPGATPPPAGDTVVFRTSWVIDTLPKAAGAAITADNAYTLYVNGRRMKSDDAWETVESINLSPALRLGTNEVVIQARNGGDSPNPAGLFFEARWQFKDGRQGGLASGSDWSCTRAKVDDQGRIKTKENESAPTWVPAVVVDGTVWRDATQGSIGAVLLQATQAGQQRVRVALLKSDLLQRTLGRPNREQIVSVRPDELSTLEAMDLSNGPLLAAKITQGAKKLATRPWNNPESLVDWLYRAALSRPPSRAELELASRSLGSSPTEEAIEDLLWSVLLLPEFQLVR